jgi:hypothetical protein
MKKTLSNILIPAIALMCFLLGSCKKDASLSRPISFVAIHNATASSLNFKIGGQDENSSAIAAGRFTGYIGVYEGQWDYEATLLTDTPVIANATVNLVGNEHHSIFVLQNNNALELFTIKDDLSVRNPNRALVKFINLSPDAESLTLELELLNNRPTFSEAKFKVPTDYQEFDEKTSYTVKLKNGLTGNDLLPETSFAFERGKMYTIWVSGRMSVTTGAGALRLNLTEMR